MRKCGLVSICLVWVAVDAYPRTLALPRCRGCLRLAPRAGLLDSVNEVRSWNDATHAHACDARSLDDRMAFCSVENNLHFTAPPSSARR